MNKLRRIFLIWLIGGCLLFLSGSIVYAQSHKIIPDLPLVSPFVVADVLSEQEPSTPTVEQGDATVMLNGQELFTFQVSLGYLSPERRALNASENILAFAKDSSSPAELLGISPLANVRLIGVNDQLIVALVKADADAVNQSLDAYAQEKLETIKAAVTNFRAERAPRQIAIGLIKAALATVAALVVFWGSNKLLRSLRRQVDQWQDQSLESIRFQRFEFLSNRQIDRIIEVLSRLFRVVIYLIILYLYIPFVLGAFPATKPLAQKLTATFWSAIGAVWQGFLGYLPNLITILVFIFIAYWASRLTKLVFKAIDRGIITLPGFYQEWAQPTSKIAVFFIWVLAGILIFPLLPASDSPSFQGISIFIGALLTLGSSTAISNIISGFISIYTRAFQVGDRIEVNGIKGDVIDKTILSTQILTPDNEVVTIPNASIISSNIVNYAAAGRDLEKPLLLTTTITLGYDIPWRKIYQVLTESALVTDGILKDPSPFVWQVSLNDYYPSYCLKAYTKEPSRMGAIYSQLHENIQDHCNAAGIEILSPGYTAVRDGNSTTIPEDYLVENYQAPRFRFESTPNKPQS